jgi:hypothetical protein
MYVCTTACVLSLILIIVALAAYSTQFDDIIAFGWSMTGDYTSSDGIVSFGLKGIASSVGGAKFVLLFEDCVGVVDYCGSCRDAGHVAFYSAFVGACGTLVMALISFIRTKDSNDTHRIWKLVAIFCGCCTLLAGAVAMSTWAAECVTSLKDSLASVDMGHGMNCMLASFIITIGTMLMHLVVAVGGPIGDNLSGDGSELSSIV